MEISLDGGVNFKKTQQDNFGNSILVDVEPGAYEIYIRDKDNSETSEYLGYYLVLGRRESLYFLSL